MRDRVIRPLRPALLLLPLAALAGGCADDKNDSIPTPPRVSGMLIDRMARPAINTALTDPFFTDASVHGGIQDSYNVASNPGQWGGLFAGRIAGNAAIYDSLDTVCGNQLLAGPSAVAGRYATLSGVLADDRIWTNSASGSCGVYLAVEANATGIIPNADCGGRTPLYDVIDVSYSVLAIGAISGVKDGVDQAPDTTPSLTTFPFLGSPH